MIETTEETATQFGWGYYERLLRCTKEAELTRKGHKANSGTLGMLRGTAYHRLIERYLKDSKPFETSEINLSDIPKGQQTEAIKAFGRFRAQYPRSVFGKIVEVEAAHTGNLENLPVSIRPDAVLRFTQRQAQRALKTFKAPIVPGTWIVDWKLYGQDDRIPFQFFRDGIRALWYREIWNRLYKLKGTKKIRGLLTHIQALNTGKFYTITAGPVMDRERTRFDRLLHRIIEVRAQGLKTNPEACVTYHRRCPFYLNGCDGH